MTALRPEPRVPVMADVARLAGVSHQTVSRVVNGQTNLRPATRQRVEEAIRQLGYRPNTAARALVTRRSATIGVIGSKSGFWGPSTVHRAIQAAGREAGYFVSSVNLQSLTRTELVDAIDHLRAQSVEGIVLISATDEALEVARAQEDLGVPVVVVEGDDAKTRWTVGVDQVCGARLGTRHLIAQGHTEIVHLAGPSTWTEARGRLLGWQQEMYDAGLRPGRPVAGDWSARSGYEAGQAIAARREVTAVFCANDQMALGLLRALHEAGRRVPDDVSVVGFDDIPEAAYLIPPLTTVRQDFGAVGRRAIEILRSAIGGSTGPASLIAPELVVRSSTAARPS
ncbi:DNA-binding LacI/PurR family transcriptional regulator [Nocardioides zeae]|uniref:DNA-binding LacI/PurR family transcriptional regulator n=2 Tax=Nocardioides zeae TaxID=1457234 RepID=A0AAJ1X0W8_9ACTN|nr:LacI family DNA-binding transcriptional regulator [Nocardioides zeae]MDQ1102804.1 DNA-binding LacI/PurR family transcriptional regulator [Nocardioides zeae]MDR6173421.1 DNA-binding LacI/PurR family transcriptional regulator [Nocardioides zeae]MDR6210827.1 DNA-binding LacI/PurR family transcriptional regulator [Nocardioides zeae]